MPEPGPASRTHLYSVWSTMIASKPTYPRDAASTVSKALSKLVLRLPRSEEQASDDPTSRSRMLAKTAARKAAAISTGLSLAPGPWGLLTIVPDLKAIWNLQSKLVADIASTFGQRASLTRESLVYCLFKHGSAALLRDIVVRSGERFVIRRATFRVLHGVLSRLGLRITERALARTLARFVPLVGAAAVGAYAYYDTSQVAANAIELFSAEVVVEPPDDRSRPEET